jgi:hypothetical protein
MRPQLCLLVLACAGPARRALHAGYVSHPRSYCGGGFKGDPHPRGGDCHTFNVHYNRPKYVNMGYMYSLPRGASYFPNYYFPLKLRYTRAPHSNSPEGGAASHLIPMGRSPTPHQSWDYCLADVWQLHVGVGS